MCLMTEIKIPQSAVFTVKSENVKASFELRKILTNSPVTDAIEVIKASLTNSANQNFTKSGTCLPVEGMFRGNKLSVRLEAVVRPSTRMGNLAGWNVRILGKTHFVMKPSREEALIHVLNKLSKIEQD